MPVPRAVRPPRFVVVHDIASWAAAVIGLEVEPWLPERLVIVPTEAHAHALRVRIADAAPEALMGTRFVTLVAAAEAVVERAGLACRRGEEARRPLRVRKVVADGVGITYYRRDRLATRGWEDALASAIGQLEKGALQAADVAPIGADAAADVAAIWEALDRDAGSSWTDARTLREAAQIIEHDAAAWPFAGATLGMVIAGTDAVEARLLRSVPRLVVGVFAARPGSVEIRARISAWFGTEVAQELERPGCRESDEGVELDVLAESLFGSPVELARVGRRTSRGPDGSVTMEAYAGVADELDAAARWVLREVHEHGTPLGDIAVLTANTDATTDLIAERIEEALAPYGGGEAPMVHVAGGRPFARTMAGIRSLTLLRALTGHLAAEEMLALIPRLRLASGPGHLRPRDALRVVERLGVVGGSAADPAGALGWRRRLSVLAEDSKLAGIVPALRSIIEIAECILGGASVSDVWRQIRDVVRTHLLVPPGGLDLLAGVDGEITAFGREPLAVTVVGEQALAVIVERVETARVHLSRYGYPCVFVGSLAHAAGLDFTAVRVIGMAESVYPGTLRADPVISDEIAQQLPPASLVRADAYGASRLQLLYRVVRGVRARFAVSTPHADLSGSEREPAALIMELAAAVARPPADGSPRAGIIPNRRVIERDWFAPARADALDRGTTTPLTAACWHDGVARGALELPSRWSADAVTDPVPIADTARAPHEGIGTVPLQRGVPGMTPDSPIAARSLEILLSCPRRFLLERVLVMRPRAELPSAYRIDPAPYGVLLHEVIEALLVAHGPALVARERDLAAWTALSEELARTHFDAYCAAHALVGDGIHERERIRLLRDVATYVADEWQRTPVDRVVGVELQFGALEVATDAGGIYLEGRLDRIDVAGGLTLVSDLKSGRARPRIREAVAPAVDSDLQLAVYLHAATALAAQHGMPQQVAGQYRYVDRRDSDRVRAFTADAVELHSAGRAWLTLAAELLRGHHFEPTPTPKQCTWCQFEPACGDAALASQARADAGGPLAVLRSLRP